MGCCGGDMSGITGWFRKLGIYGYLLIGILMVIAAYFILVHQAHLAAYSTIIFIVIFFGLHMVMCGMGHGEKDGGSCGGSHGEDQKKEPGKDAGTATAGKNDQEKKGGSCH